MGFGDIFKIVVAEDEKKAEELARIDFKKEADETTIYNENYYSNLEVKILQKNISQGVIYTSE
jgi:hypothetical protein